MSGASPPATAPEKLTTSGATPLVGEAEMLALGWLSSDTLIETVSVAVSPSSSDTERCTVYEPPTVKVCAGLTSVEELPSPKTQR